MGEFSKVSPIFTCCSLALLAVLGKTTLISLSLLKDFATSTGEVTLNVKEFNSSAAWGISPFSFAEGLMKSPLHPI